MRSFRLSGMVTAAGLVVCTALLAGPAPGAPPGGVLQTPGLGHRTRPYAPAGSGGAGGGEEYFALLNARGGLDGQTIQWNECEDAYDTARGVECYERIKKDAAFIFPESTNITYALFERSIHDKIPLVTIGYGRSDATDGKTFPWLFPVLGNYWS